MELESMQQQLQQLQNKITHLESVTNQSTARPKKSRAARIAIAVALFLIPVVAFGVTITKPYTFVGGQPISASELNENFDTVYDRVNELGVLKVKVGSTVLGTVVSGITGKTAYFITDEGYVSIVGENVQNSITLGIRVFPTYHTVSDCSDTAILSYSNTKTVVNVATYPGTNLAYGTGTLPTAVPGYFKNYGTCYPNSQAGTQTTANFTTIAANDESITGVPNSISGSFLIVLE